MPRRLTPVVRRVREDSDDVRREIVEKTPPRGRKRAAIEGHLNRRGLTHHANAKRSATIEVPRHRLVSIDEEL